MHVLKKKIFFNRFVVLFFFFGGGGTNCLFFAWEESNLLFFVSEGTNWLISRYSSFLTLPLIFAFLYEKLNCFFFFVMRDEVISKFSLLKFDLCMYCNGRTARRVLCF